MVYFAPINPILFLQKMIFLMVYIFVEFYTIKFFLLPYFQNYQLNHTIGLIFTIYWLFISLTWLKSYFHVSWLDAGSVKNEIKRLSLIFNQNVLENKLKNLTLCQKCGIHKPNRSHHCSHCKRCYIRFDHHCPSVGNCIAYRNAQPFALYLSYGSIILFSTSLVSFFAPYFESPIQVSLARSIAVLIGLCAFALSLFAYNTLSSLMNDQTTLERLYRLKTGHNVQGEDLKPFWGNSPFIWIIPHSPSMNGLIWSKSVSLGNQNIL
ncbi:DHHC zinc finger domain containing protein [Tritrichomonas foetus]|uniref:Palmitoyltransferase n=1 Tax=Tritrichomonas foetus TaxID=1144522 RepID=A0A1J4JAW0_9EUKA|nr:DHHC zinc finger domain containing protein [Tritrichomonas foetus]|eukprot:OHS96322.1 DHHC zinc finger domain containing protein [Tritrichomonas foetus]